MRRVYWCGNCETAVLGKRRTKCHTCKGSLVESGWVETPKK